MATDISSKEDIKHLVDTFYKRVMVDPVIGHFFTEVVNLDLEAHLPIMYKFWASILFGDLAYTGNPMEKHIAMNKKSPMEAEHFDRWLEMWMATVDELFAGDTADMAKKRAEGIRHLMAWKVKDSE